VSRLFIVKEYIQYRFNALNRHGVHSPFVYTFNDEVIADDRHFYAYGIVENFREKLYKNKSKITIQDFGAGSLHTASNVRTVASIARLAGRSHHHGKLLFKMVNYYGAKRILELGTSMGLGTSYLAFANTDAQVISIEGSQEIAAQAGKHFTQLGLQNITQIVGNFDTILQKTIQENAAFDFVFVDGNHQYAPTVNYFNMLIEKVAAEAIIVFDDIHWSEGMKKAWQEIVADSRVKLSIDVFQFGIIFISKNFKEKQHFVIKY
jgi:predicted O-methyltransferase YrrM